eukprot:scaffold45852_cov33-Prasinocladus_malaysianus.AAC.1
MGWMVAGSASVTNHPGATDHIIELVSEPRCLYSLSCLSSSDYIITVNRTGMAPGGIYLANTVVRRESSTPASRASQSSLAIARAAVLAVAPSAALMAGSAPAARSSLTAKACPRQAASINGVTPAPSTASTSTPASTRARSRKGHPRSAASCSFSDLVVWKGPIMKPAASVNGADLSKGQIVLLNSSVSQ